MESVNFFYFFFEKESICVLQFGFETVDPQVIVKSSCLSLIHIWNNMTFIVYISSSLSFSFGPGLALTLEGRVRRKCKTT